MNTEKQEVTHKKAEKEFNSKRSLYSQCFGYVKVKHYADYLKHNAMIAFLEKYPNIVLSWCMTERIENGIK